MTPGIKINYENLYSDDKDLRYSAFQNLIDLTDQPVDWAYDVWNDLLKLTKDKDSHLRTIAVQLISNLAKNDCDQRMLTDFPLLYNVTLDEKFVTARHSLLCLWKIAIVNDAYSRLVVTALTKRFREASKEKNGTLVRYDILQVFKKIFEHNNVQAIRQLSLELIVTEADPKYKKKYTSLWKMT